MKNSVINNININRAPHIIFIIIGVILCTNLSITSGSQFGIVIGLLPIIILTTLIALAKTSISLTFLFAANYLVMGLGRYISYPMPVTNLFDLMFSVIIAFILIKQIYSNDDFTKTLNIYTFITFIWLIYCTINIGNNVTGEIHAEAWLRTVRPLAVYPFITCIVISLCCKHYSFLQYFLIVLTIFTILGAGKGIMQKYIGFDNTEYAWVSTAGAKTHLINSGVRYFSFFTDAANFGCSMGFSFVVLFISSLFTKSKIIKSFYLVSSGLAIWGLLLSGTRAAIAVPFVGFALFTIIAKNWKLIIFSISCFTFALFILMFTNIGNGNPFIRRMRSAFNTEDASMQVRLENQKALKSYMDEAPFGIGIGVQPADISIQNKFYFVSICAPDSDFVYIWMRLGVVGLSVYLILQFFIYAIGSYIILFKIKNQEIRGPLSAMLCGCAGMLIASYANQVGLQFPNGLITFTCLTLVFIGPYLDKQYTLEHESK